MTRRLTPEQASAVYDVLVECAGAVAHADYREEFQSDVAWINETGHGMVTVELDDETGWVVFVSDASGTCISCEPEQETSARLAAIERTNARLAALLGEGGA